MLLNVTISLLHKSNSALTLLLIFIRQEGSKQHKEERTNTDKQTAKK